MTTPNPWQNDRRARRAEECRPPRSLGSVTILSVVLSVAAAGCHAPTHKAQRAETERKWNELRSQVKARLAAEQLDQGRLDDAIASLREAIELNPGSPACHRLLAKCLLEKGGIKAAVESLDVAASIGDTSADQAYLRGLVAERQAQPGEALAYYRRAAKLDPGNVDYLLAVAETLVATDRAVQAARLLETRTADFDRDPKVLLLRANVYVILGELDKAAADLADVRTLLPDASWLSDQYGVVLTRLGRYREALAVFESSRDGPAKVMGKTSHRADGSASRPASVVRALSTCYLRTGRPTAARTLLERHVGAFPDDARAWWLLAEACLRLGDTGGVRRCLQRGEKLKPDSPDWQVLRAYVAWRSHDDKRAASVLESIVARHPDNVLAHCFLGELYDEHAAADRARAHYESALRIDPRCSWASQRLGTGRMYAPAGSSVQPPPDDVAPHP